MTGIACLIGIHMVVAIGGADMPVVVSMLNSYSGWAAAAAGFMLKNDALIVGPATLGVLGGWDIAFMSGEPVRKLYYNDYYGDWYAWGDDGDNPDRLPAWSQTDVRAGLHVDLDRFSFDVTLDIFNVFNSRAVTSVWDIYGDEDGEGIYVDETTGAPLYWQPYSYQRGRWARLGLRGEF